MPESEKSAAQNKIMKRVIMIWIGVVVFSLAAPVWLPLSGFSRGRLGDFIIGVITAIVISVIFMRGLKEMRKAASE